MMIPILAEASELMMYLLPAIGSMLVIYGIFQVVSESRSSTQKKVQERLRGRRPSRQKTTVNIVRRGALGEPTSFADSVLGKVSFIPRLQSLLDQADVDWSAPASGIDADSSSTLFEDLSETQATRIIMKAITSRSPANRK